MLKIERKWDNGDIVEISFNSKVRTEKRMNNSLAVAWGPLYFSLRIGEAFKKIEVPEDRRVYPEYPTGVANWSIDPTTPWNYALVVDPQNPDFEMITSKISSIPFARRDEPVFLPGATSHVPWTEDVPVILKARARLVPEWGMNGASADTVPVSPVSVSTEETVVELIPYGCTRLRISEFPFIFKSN